MIEYDAAANQPLRWLRYEKWRDLPHSAPGADTDGWTFHATRR